MICKAHHYHMNGCTGLVFSKDCQHIVTIGDKNIINCWNWELVVPKSMQSVFYIVILTGLQTMAEQKQRLLENIWNGCCIP